MAIDNVNNAAVNFPRADATLNAGLTSPASLTLGLSPAALQSPELRALLASLNPTQSSPVAQQPLPFSLTSLPASIFDPVQLNSSLDSTSTGLQSAIDSLNQQVSADQAAVNADATNGASPQQQAEDQQKLLTDMQQLENMISLQTTIQSIFANLDRDIINNMKVQG
jgi:hypothetical protein